LSQVESDLSDIEEDQEDEKTQETFVDSPNLNE